MDRATAVELVTGLVEIPSISRQEAIASTWLVSQMRGAGFDRAFLDEAGNAVGELGDSDAARTIVLLGHIDTVPGNIAVRIENDRLFGRGSVDAKGPLATFVAGAARFGAIAFPTPASSVNRVIGIGSRLATKADCCSISPPINRWRTPPARMPAWHQSSSTCGIG
jgi:acetylornithine deacetylase/succinyl-diaminopimelate desuccinylase-like protein